MKILTISLVLRKNYNKNKEYMHITLLVTLFVSEINQCLDIRKKVKKHHIMAAQWMMLVDHSLHRDLLVFTCCAKCYNLKQISICY